MRTKYPRTFHVPFSPGATSDDKVLQSLAHFEGRRVSISRKMDGENTTLYPDYFHARSLDSRHHTSRDWLARFHASIAHDIPEGWRVCGENLYAQHSLAYTDLPSYFMGFSVWTAENRSLSRDDRLEFFELLGVEPVPELYYGVFDEALIRAMVKTLDTTVHEGFVISLAESFHFDEFKTSVAKWVRRGHVQTDQHWSHGTIVPNALARTTI